MPLDLRGSVSTHHAGVEQSCRADRAARTDALWRLRDARGYTVTGIDRKNLHSNPHTCGCPGGGPWEVPPTCRCHLPHIVDSPTFVPDRASSTVGVGGLRGLALAWSCRPVDEAARATWPGRKLRRLKQKQQRPTFTSICTKKHFRGGERVRSCRFQFTPYRALSRVIFVVPRC